MQKNTYAMQNVHIIKYAKMIWASTLSGVRRKTDDTNRLELYRARAHIKCGMEIPAAAHCPSYGRSDQIASIKHTFTIHVHVQCIDSIPSAMAVSLLPPVSLLNSTE